MPEARRKAQALDSNTDLGGLTPEAGQDLLLRHTDVDPRGGDLRVFGHRYLLLRPETLVNIQRQLEQTLGVSTKGFLYLAGEKSARDGHHVIEALLAGIDTSSAGPEVLKRLSDIGALLGWGRFEVTSMDLELPRIIMTLEDSPIAASYGPAKKPVCHFLAGWLAGIGRSVLGNELLCEETACAAQGRPRCEFQLRAMPFR